MSLNRVLTVVMDGVGITEDSYGNAFRWAKTPCLDQLKEQALWRTIKAHGTYVGLPSDDDIGNSEVGHNALGAGNVYDQGAKLVQKAVDENSLCESGVWQEMLAFVKAEKGALHLIGLLSDGNVHSHQDHLHALISGAKRDGVRRVYLHMLLDGRDVGEKTAEVYIERLEAFLSKICDETFTVEVASGGGRMRVTMDRYEADWSIVEKGWRAYVLGEAEYAFSSLREAVVTFRKDSKLTDQYFPSFVIGEMGRSNGCIHDGDGVIFFNFRGDRAVEICRAFDEAHFDKFDRVRVPRVFFAGMMEYDGDLHIPEHYLVPPPRITGTFSEFLANMGVRQFACSETQKFGHVTYFWNGNRSGKFNEQLEEYIEIPSDKIDFDSKPAMKAKEIAQCTVDRLRAGSFDYGRINLANGDMVGHTGNFAAAVAGMEAVDRAVALIKEACDETGTILMITADHGNCDVMLEGRAADHPDWTPEDIGGLMPKTAHTKNPVPLYLYFPSSIEQSFSLKSGMEDAGLANIANTVLDLMSIGSQGQFLPSLVEKR